MATTIIYGPQGSGKTTLAETLATHFKCSQVVDEWDGESELAEDTLALTSVAPPYDAPHDSYTLDHAVDLALSKGPGE